MVGLADNYLNSIRGFEGFHRRPYWDYRQWTSGYGTRASGPDETIDEPEADRRFRGELGRSLDSVRGLGVTMTPGQEAALTSLTYNAGPRWMTSGLGAAVRAGDWRTARERFLQYVNAGGRPLPGLQRRRAQEAAWLDAPAPLGAPAPVAAEGAPQGWGSLLGIGTAQAQTPGGAPKGSPENPYLESDAIPPDAPDGTHARVGQNMLVRQGGSWMVAPSGGAGVQGGPPVAGRMGAPEVAPPPEQPLGPPNEVLLGGPATGLSGARPRSPFSRFLDTPIDPAAPPVPPVPPFGAPTVTPAPPPEQSLSDPSTWQPMGHDLTRDIAGQLGPPQAPPPDADAIVRGAEQAAATRAPEPRRPDFLERLGGEPLFQAGLAILGTAPGGNWGPAGVQALQGATRARREQSEYERLQSRRTVMDRVWREAFGANGQPNMSHPLMQGMPPEMASTIYAMGPEEGLPALQRWQFYRGQQAEQLRTRQAQMQSALERFGVGGQPQPGGEGGQPGSGIEGLRAQAGLPGAMPGGSVPGAVSWPGSGATPTAPSGQAGSEPVVRIGAVSMPVSQARAYASALDAAGQRSEVLEQAITAAERSGQAPEALRTRAMQADQAYNSLTTALEGYQRLVQQEGITAVPGPARDAVIQARTNILLQLKELYNLGVLNGPDLALMESMLPDTSLSAGNVMSNPSGRVASSVARLREILRVMRNSQTGAIGLPPIPAPGGGSGQQPSGDGFSIRRLD